MAVLGNDGSLGNAHLVEVLHQVHEKMEAQGGEGACPRSPSIWGWSSLSPPGTHCGALQSQHCRRSFFRKPGDRSHTDVLLIDELLCLTLRCWQAQNFQCFHSGFWRYENVLFSTQHKHQLNKRMVLIPLCLSISSSCLPPIFSILMAR